MHPFAAHSLELPVAAPAGMSTSASVSLLSITPVKSRSFSWRSRLTSAHGYGSCEHQDARRKGPCTGTKTGSYIALAVIVIMALIILGYTDISRSSLLPISTSTTTSTWSTYLDPNQYPSSGSEAITTLSLSPIYVAGIVFMVVSSWALAMALFFRGLEGRLAEAKRRLEMIKEEGLGQDSSEGFFAVDMKYGV